MNIPATSYLERWQGFAHQTVDHRKGEYVRGVVHTNNMESFWSLLKRGIMGSFHHVSADYLPLYVAEFAFRHNRRNEADAFGSAHIERLATSRVRVDALKYVRVQSRIKGESRKNKRHSGRTRAR